jgi:DNA-3-methyladenine glycosylase II
MEAGLARLIDREPRFARVLAEAGPLPWRRRPPGFPGLLRALTGQMISDAAAEAIWARLAALPGALAPEGLLALPESALAAAGLSRAKLAAARALAEAVASGRLPIAALPGWSDSEAVARLAALPGLGRWTAEVHLLFAEGRADIFPGGDLALAAGVADLFALPARPSPRALALLAAPWSPDRSLAARLLWHWWRHVRPGGAAAAGRAKNAAPRRGSQARDAG